MDRNLLLTEFTKSGVNFKANLNKIVIYTDFTPNYEKRLTGNCFLITYDEYLKIDQPVSLIVEDLKSIYIPVK